MKKNLLLITSLILALASCKNKNNSTSSSSSTLDTETQYTESTSTSKSSEESTSIKKSVRSISIDEFENGVVEANKFFAYEGDVITLNVIANEGYELLEGNLKYNGNVITNNTFVMPDCNVTIEALFTKIPIIYPQTDMYITSKVNDNEAKAYIEAKYELAGISFKITVIDNEIITDGYDLEKRDSIMLLINKTSDVKGLVADETIKFNAAVDGLGYYELYRASSKFNFGEKNDINLNVSPGNNFFTSSYTTTFDNVSAYVINAYFGYDLLSTNYEEGFENISICPGLVNANSDGINIELGQKGYSYETYWKNSSTFAKVNGTNSFEKRATGTSEDILDEDVLPENYIKGVNIIGQDQWNVGWIKLNKEVDLENVTSIIVEVRFNVANNSDWFRLVCKTNDDIFYDAFGKDYQGNFRYSCSENIKEIADYDWETGQWGGWDPSWNSKIAPTYYVEVPLECMFARFGLTGNMTEMVNNPLSNGTNKKLSQIGVYLTANAKYDFSIGKTYVRRNGVVEEISNPDNYSVIVEDGKDYCYASKVDSNQEKDSTLEVKIYSKSE